MRFKTFILVVLLISGVTHVFAQTKVSAGSSQTTTEQLPDAPSATARNCRRHPPRLLASDPYEPLTRKQKLHDWLHRTYSGSTFVSAGVDTLYTGITGGIVYCCEASAWGDEYGASLANAEARSFFGRFLFPTLLKQDPRYFPKREGSLIGRAWYATTRVLVTRNDKGKNVFNSSEFLGIALSKALTNAYYPNSQKTFGRTANSMVGALEGDASGHLLTEFTPELERIFRRHAPQSVQKISGTVGITPPPTRH